VAGRWSRCLARDGLADRIRFYLNVKREQCPYVGMTDTVRVLRDGTLAMSCMPMAFGEMKLVGEDGPEQVFMWRVAVGREAGAWRVIGMLHDPLDIQEWIKLPPDWWANATRGSGPVN